MGNAIYAVFGLAESLLLFRFLFRLFGASADTLLVAWTTNLSRPLVAPFASIFSHSPRTATGGVFELGTLIALVVIGVIGAIVIEVCILSRRSDY